MPSADPLQFPQNRDPKRYPILYVYGPPGSGKSTIGRRLSEALALPFTDLDEQIAAQTGHSIPEIFNDEGEAGFRTRETAALVATARQGPAVVALGGGALLDERCRTLAEQSGMVLCLSAGILVLVDRLSGLAGTRPLLSSASHCASQSPRYSEGPYFGESPRSSEGPDIGDPAEGSPAELEARLTILINARRAHYASFPLQFDTTASPEQIVWAIQVRLGMFHVTGMGRGYDVLIQPGGLDRLGEALQARGLAGPVALVSDERVAPLYAGRAATALAATGYQVHEVTLPAGEAHKTLGSLTRLWEEFLAGGLERSSTVVALGGGVISDLTGFAASTFLRGVTWVAVPTTLLAMVDASLGGKTAIDLPQGKNLIGAFHPPALVLADPDTLDSLPEPELRNGLAEVVKHGLLRDPALFSDCARGWSALQSGDWTALVRRATAVKVHYIQVDPFEQGERAALNLGHTIGHAVEQASHFNVRHGEAVAIGMVAAARLSVRAGLAQPELVEEIGGALAGLGLPTCLPDGIDPAEVLPLLQLDKKKRGGQVRFVLPLKVGEARHGVALDLDIDTLREVTR